MQEKQYKILDLALKHVPFDGWNDNILKLAAKEAGFGEKYAKVAFKRGATEAIELFLERINTETFAKIKESKLESMKIREKIFYILDTRLRIMEGYKPVIRKTTQFLVMPQNLLLAGKLLWDMADKIWYAAGDKATDFNHYTKRTTLMAVYSSTLLFWLNDESDDHKETSAFLKRRIENVMQFEKVKGKIKNFAGRCL